MNHLSDTIKTVIDKKGVQFIDSTAFYNMLLDLGGFRENEDIKFIFRTATNDGYMKQILDAYSSKRQNYELLINKMANSLSIKYGFNQEKAIYMFQCVMGGLGYEVPIHKGNSTISQLSKDQTKQESKQIQRSISKEPRADKELDKPFSESPIPIKDMDPLFIEAAHYVIRQQSVSTAMIQKRFLIGFQRAYKVLDQLHEAGIVGSAEGYMPRDVLVNNEDTLTPLLKRIHSNN